MTPRFEQAVIAFKLGMTMSQFDALDANDKAYAIVTYRSLNLMEAYESQIAEQERK